MEKSTFVPTHGLMALHSLTRVAVGGPRWRTATEPAAESSRRRGAAPSEGVQGQPVGVPRTSPPRAARRATGATARPRPQLRGECCCWAWSGREDPPGGEFAVSRRPLFSWPRECRRSPLTATPPAHAARPCACPRSGSFRRACLRNITRHAPRSSATAAPVPPSVQSTAAQPSPPQLLGGKVGVVRLDDTDDDAEDGEGRGENLHDQNLNEQRWVLRVREGTAAPRNSDGDSAVNVWRGERRWGSGGGGWGFGT